MKQENNPLYGELLSLFKSYYTRKLTIQDKLKYNNMLMMLEDLSKSYPYLPGPVNISETIQTITHNLNKGTIKRSLLNEAYHNHPIKSSLFKTFANLNKDVLSNKDNGHSPINPYNSNDVHSKLSNNDLKTSLLFRNKMIDNPLSIMTSNTHISNMTLLDNTKDSITENSSLSHSNKTMSVPFPIELINTQPLQHVNIYLTRLISQFDKQLAKNQYVMYHFNSRHNRILKPNLNNLLEYTFNSMNMIISEPKYWFTPNLITIELFYLSQYEFRKPTNERFYKDYFDRIRQRHHLPQIESMKERLNVLKQYKSLKLNNQMKTLLDHNINRQQLHALSIQLSHILHTNVTIELTRLYYPFYSPDIFVKYLSMFINTIKLRIIFESIFRAITFRKSNSNTNRYLTIPSSLSGFIVKVAGPIMTRKIIPRKTVKIIQKGSYSRKHDIFLLDKGRFTHKSKRGAFSISVSTAYTK